MKELDLIVCNTLRCLICSSRPLETAGGRGGGEEEGGLSAGF